MNTAPPPPTNHLPCSRLTRPSTHNRATGRVHMQSFATKLLAPGRNSGWFILENQMREKVVTNRISPSARYYNRPGVESYRPLDGEFPRCLKGFK